MPECNIVDVLTDTEHWLNWTAAFGPLSGFEARLISPRLRHVTTTFCYGYYLGPTQTCRSMKDRGYAALLSRSRAGSVWEYPLKLSCRLSL
jgi:Tn3 transposase DDE domain